MPVQVLHWGLRVRQSREVSMKLHGELIRALLVVVLFSIVVLPPLYYTRTHKPIDHILTTQQVLEQKYHKKDPESLFLATAIHEASVKNKVSEDVILGIINKESHFNHKIKGKRGELGYMQVMPVWDKVCPYDRHNQYENILQGVCVFKHSSKGQTSLHNSLSVYNIGITNFIK